MAYRASAGMAALAFALTACGGGDGAPNHPQTEVSVESPPQTKAPAPVKSEPEPRKSRNEAMSQVSEASPWEAAMPLDSQLLVDIYHWLNPEIAKSESHALFQACNLNVDSFRSAASNEFEWPEFVAGAQEASGKRVDQMKADKSLQSGAPLLFRGTLQPRLGDYDFDTEAFPFVPISFDVLQENIDVDLICQLPNGDQHRKPTTWPSKLELQITNRDAITSLPMPRQDAKSFVEAMTNHNHVSSSLRTVIFEFVIAVDPSSLSLQEKRLQSPWQGKAEVVYARVRAFHDKKIIAQFTEDSFR